jgi:hypothetical protein
MTTKTWKVVTNTGKQAELDSGSEKKVVQKPTHITPRESVHWLAVGSHIDDGSCVRYLSGKTPLLGNELHVLTP